MQEASPVGECFSPCKSLSLHDLWALVHGESLQFETGHWAKVTKAFKSAYNPDARGGIVTVWSASKARAQFSALLDKVESEGPQIIKRGNQEFRVMTMEQLEEQLSLRNPKISVAEFLAISRCAAPRSSLAVNAMTASTPTA